ncbi:MAG: tetratricopeptide repeat protein [Thermodesulfobacteriota bacterium]
MLSLSWAVMVVTLTHAAATPQTVADPPAPPASSTPPTPGAQPAPPAPPVPSPPPTPTKTAMDYFKSGSIHLGGGNLEQALADFTEAIRLKPNFWAAYLNRGTALRRKGEFDQAIADYNQAIQMKPDLYDAYTLRGICYGKKGQYQEAIADYARALEKKPHYLTYNGLAWIYATSKKKECRNGARAVELAQKAVLFHRNANSLSTLAAAYAETGKFKEAIETQEAALELLHQRGPVPQEELAGYDQRLQAYQSHKPWRE